MSRRDLGINLAVLGTTLALLALLLEGYFRYAYMKRIEASKPADERECDIAAINHAPVFPDDPFQLRDYDYHFSKGDTYRIVAIGDSFTHGGRHVSLCDSWPKQLEAKLRTSLGQGIEVVNGGMPGWNTTQELKYLMERGLRFEPDLVIVGYFLNDATRMPTNPTLIRRGTGAARSDGPPVSYLVDAVRGAVAKRVMTTRAIQEYKDAFFVKQRLWIENQRALLALKALSEREGFDLLVVVYPILYRLDDDYPFADIIATIETFLVKNEIPSLSLLPHFIGYRDLDLWVTPENAHPNTRANDIASSAIEDTVVDRYRSAD